MRDRVQGPDRFEASLADPHRRASLPLPPLLALVRLPHRSEAASASRTSLASQRQRRVGINAFVVVEAQVPIL